MPLTVSVELPALLIVNVLRDDDPSETLPKAVVPLSEITRVVGLWAVTQKQLTEVGEAARGAPVPAETTDFWIAIGAEAVDEPLPPPVIGKGVSALAVWGTPVSSTTLFNDSLLPGYGLFMWASQHRIYPL